MTYTFKLARRLAIMRHFIVLIVLALVLACSKDLTAPDGGRPEGGPTVSPVNPTSLEIFPQSVTIETSQRVLFRGQTRTLSGEPIPAAVAWVASGGVIDSSGQFSASTPGIFKVFGRGRGGKNSNPSIVHVVPAPVNLARLTVTPRRSKVRAGITRAFTAKGFLKNGSAAEIGVVWSATGGVIDPSGVYTAGHTPGRYRVIATSHSRHVADTSYIRITPANEPTPTPSPNPAAPTLASVVITPSTVSLVGGSSKQFAAYGRDSDGDSVAVVASFAATGGSITSGGLYTAGSVTGTYRVVVTASGISDTASVTLTPRIVAGGQIGLPFGPSHQIDKSGSVSGPFSMSHDGYSSSTIISRINAARAGGYRLLFALTDGKHENYMSGGVFDEAKWRAKMNTFDSPAIKQAVAQAVSEGIIIGASVMDEPQVSGGQAGGGNTWGPKGTMTKARVDGLCQYVKQMFPTLPVGVFHQHNTFEPDKSYKSCEFIIDQYDHRRGDVTAFRDDGLALARRDGMSIMFSLNILDGGVQDKDGNYDCSGPGQGGKGTFAPNCRMTPDEIREWGQKLGPVGCGLFLWRYDSGFIAQPANQQAFKELGAMMASAPRKSCGRP
jgi:hypothetical protein